MLIATAALACLASCAGKEPAPENSSVQVFRTETVLGAAAAPEGLQATVVWPSDRDRDHFEIAALADPLIDLDPAWGSYVGIMQMESESDAGVTRENHLDIELASLESIDPLIAFCEQHYPNSIVLIHCDADEAMILSADDIIQGYGSGGG